MTTISRILGGAAAGLLMLTVPALAQDAPPPATPEAATPEVLAPEAAADDPHAMLPALTGGPMGSPTALRGNPVPGTSTAIPTTNPADVMPLPVREGRPLGREDTGIDGQCDPVVSLANCPERPAAAATPAAPAGIAGDGAAGGPGN